MATKMQNNTRVLQDRKKTIRENNQQKKPPTTAATTLQPQHRTVLACKNTNPAVLVTRAKCLQLKDQRVVDKENCRPIASKASSRATLKRGVTSKATGRPAAVVRETKPPTKVQQPKAPVTAITNPQKNPCPSKQLVRAAPRDDDDKKETGIKIPTKLLELPLLDLDAATVNDPQMCSEYAREIYSYLLSVEDKPHYHILPSFMDAQRELRDVHRRILVDWLVQVQIRYGLFNETLYVSVDILDRYLQKEQVSKDKLQLVGITSMMIASKYEEIYPPMLSDFIHISADTYDPCEMREMEIQILRQLGYLLNKPLTIHFLRRYSRAADADTVEHNLSKYILELAILDSETSAVRPSLKAAAAFLISRLIYRSKSPEQVWTKAMQEVTGYSLEELGCTRDLLENSLSSGHCSSTYHAVSTKYSSPVFMNVSFLKILEEKIGGRLRKKL